MDEGTGELGTGFSAPTAVRKVALRMSIVLGAGGGALNPFINLARMGSGGPMGDGDQRFSWVHVDDVVAAIAYVFEHPEISGPVNVAAPEVVTNAEMMRQVRATLGRSRGIPLPAWALGAGARIIRTEPELVLKSRWVDSRVLRESGFSFTYPSLSAALDQIAGNTPRGLLPVALG